MRRLGRLSDRDLDRIVAGESSPDDRDAAALASFARAARRRADVPPSIEALHLTAVVDAARKLAPAAAHPSTPARRRPRLSRTLVPAGVAASIVTKMAAAGAAALTTAGALTAAGVVPGGGDLQPAVVERHSESAWGFLPEPLDESTVAAEHASQTAKDVLGVVDGWLAGGYATGCEFGRAVAGAASGRSTGACPGGSGDDGQDGPGSSAAGKARAAEKSEAGKARGEDASAQGKATAQEASAQGKATAQEASAQGKATAQEKSAAGKAQGGEASSAGAVTTPQVPPAGGGGGSAGGAGAPNAGSHGAPANPPSK